jgi:hypothetical protein
LVAAFSGRAEIARSAGVDIVGGHAARHLKRETSP